MLHTAICGRAASIITISGCFFARLILNEVCVLAANVALDMARLLRINATGRLAEDDVLAIDALNLGKSLLQFVSHTKHAEP
jgi:hypothetical protein